MFWANRNWYPPSILVTVQDVSIDYADETDRTGDINGGSITMSGVLRSAQWRQSGDIESIVLDGKSGDQLLMSPSNVSSSEPDHFTIQRDTGTSFPDADIFCLPIRISVASGTIPSDTPLVEGLVLGPTDEKDCYVRLGYFETVGEGYRRALFYELKDKARGLNLPWDMMMFEEGTQGGYDENLFLKLEKSVFKIVWLIICSRNQHQFVHLVSSPYCLTKTHCNPSRSPVHDYTRFTKPNVPYVQTYIHDRLQQSNATRPGPPGLASTPSLAARADKISSPSHPETFSPTRRAPRQQPSKTNKKQMAAYAAASRPGAGAHKRKARKKRSRTEGA
jgi:hypothetical protein